MNEETVDYKVTEVDSAERLIEQELELAETSLLACSTFVAWVKEQDDKFQFVDNLVKLDTEKKYSVWDYPISNLLQEIADNPTMVADMIGAYYKTAADILITNNERIGNDNKRAARINEKQAAMITSLRGLVAKGKLAKFDEANKNA